VPVYKNNETFKWSINWKTMYPHSNSADVIGGDNMKRQRGNKEEKEEIERFRENGK
jgi:hypothetical protein